MKNKAFLKPWNKLRKVHKIIKLKEYGKNLSESDFEELLEGLPKKKFTKKKNIITYDEELGKITDISCIKEDKLEWQ